MDLLDGMFGHNSDDWEFELMNGHLARCTENSEEEKRGIDGFTYL